MACMKTTISFCVCAFFVFLNYSVILSRVHTFWGDFFICAVSMLFSSILKIFLEPVRQNHYHYYFNNPKLVHHVFCSAPIYLFTFCVAFFRNSYGQMSCVYFFCMFNTNIVLLFFCKSNSEKRLLLFFAKAIVCLLGKKVSFSFGIIETNNVLWLLRRIYSIRGTMTEVWMDLEFVQISSISEKCR